MGAFQLIQLGGIGAVDGGLRATGRGLDSRERALDPAYGIKGTLIPHGHGIA